MSLKAEALGSRNSPVCTFATHLPSAPMEEIEERGDHKASSIKTSPERLLPRASSSVEGLRGKESVREASKEH